jgi:hypothetical protein
LLLYNLVINYHNRVIDSPKGEKQVNKFLRITLMSIGILALAGGLVFAGAWIGRRTGIGFGWMHPGTWMMNNRNFDRGASPYGPGMMGGYGRNNANVTPLTTDQAFQAAGKYLAALKTPDLKIAEVMVFDNNAYVRVVEQSTGIGAFELLVDPASQVVYPEHGPNMMWNLKYSGINHQQMMGGGRGMMGGAGGNVPGMGMMGNYGSNATPADVSTEMPVTPAQALKTAQQYLDSALPGTKTAPDADPFYGYYTIDILRDGKTVGMLSVNGFSGQVFLHSWHGTFIEAKDY